MMKGISSVRRETVQDRDVRARRWRASLLVRGVGSGALRWATSKGAFHTGLFMTVALPIASNALRTVSHLPPRQCKLAASKVLARSHAPAFRHAQRASARDEGHMRCAGALRFARVGIPTRGKPWAWKTRQATP